MNLEFTGNITDIRTPRGGTTDKGEWANAEFEVTESNPQNPQYPQVALFDFFKNGEYLKYAKDFETYYPLGTEVKVEFNLKKNTYTKPDGNVANFYKTSAWRVNKVDLSVEQGAAIVDANFEPAEDLQEEEDDNLPF